MNAAQTIDNIPKDPAQLVEQFRDPLWGAEQLKNISLFNEFTSDELQKLYSIGTLVRLKAKTSAVVEGEPTRGLFVLLYGNVSVYKTDPVTGSLIRLAILEEGANFGELSLFDNVVRSATVMAESNCYLFQLDAEPFNEFLDEMGADIKVRFYKTCAEELVGRFRTLNSDYISSQQLLWKYALRKTDEVTSDELLDEKAEESAETA